MLPEDASKRRAGEFASDKVLGRELDDRLLDANQEDYSLYRDQLQLTERHLDGLIDDANATLHLLTTLSNAFQSVENQTSSFQAQCEDLLNEQRRLEKLADDVGTDLHYYAYLETATRRLNGPGASRLVDDESFGDMVENLEACIVFMDEHVSVGMAVVACVVETIGKLMNPRRNTVTAINILRGTTPSSRKHFIFLIMASPPD